MTTSEKETPKKPDFTSRYYLNPTNGEVIGCWDTDDCEAPDYVETCWYYAILRPANNKKTVYEDCEGGWFWNYECANEVVEEVFEKTNQLVELSKEQFEEIYELC